MEESRGGYLTRSSMLFVIVAFVVVGSWGGNVEACSLSSCGNIRNISFPFRLNTETKHCKESKIILYCENNLTIFKLQSGRYYVQEINYGNRIIRVVDPGIQKNDCSSIPRYPLADGSYYSYYINDFYETFTDDHPSNEAVTFLKCANPVNSSLYVDTAPCIAASESQPKTYGYVRVGYTSVSEIENGCGVEWSTPMAHSQYHWLFREGRIASYKYIHNALAYGFEIGWYEDPSPADSSRDPSPPADSPRDPSPPADSTRCRGYMDSECVPYTIAGFFNYLARLLSSFLVANPVLSLFFFIVFGVFFLARFMLGIGFLIYKWRKRHLSVYSTIEDFLQSDNFIPIRYSYSDIKKMTGGFKDKLGEGGYGSVFKGKLRSCRFGAIKMLGKPKANGQEFISEIATLGRIHHVNVVQLVGYCVEGSKRALVYDFMPNGSLDKYIYSKEASAPLGCEKMYEICIGVAKGIEYLHQGCDMQILHFDIKPHNILLDEIFIPKISDFGLAKLYRIDDSIVSLTAARGTMGYIAPELFYKNIGRVSYKADVYSFGMLLMEMASRRKNLNAIVDHSSQIYFPSWVYDQYNEGKDLDMNYVLEDEKHMIKKMVITALWCIQLKPDDRPSMKKVLEMLEGSVEHLQMPPKPYLCPQQMPVVDIHDSNLDPACSKTELTISTLSAR